MRSKREIKNRVRDLQKSYNQSLNDGSGEFASDHVKHEGAELSALYWVLEWDQGTGQHPLIKKMVKWIFWKSIVTFGK